MTVYFHNHRPRRNAIATLLAAGFSLRIEPMTLEPYHFGMVGEV